MKNFIQPGDVVTAIAPSGGVVSGGFYLIGNLFGVAATTAAQGAEFEFKLTGVFEGAKAASQAWNRFATIYWDDAAKNFTNVASGNKAIGVAMLAVDNAAGSTTGRVRLNGVSV